MNASLGPAVCRVCLCGESSVPYLGKTAGEPLISPCHCKGTMGLYHRSCLEHWLSTSRTTCCEICKFKYEIGRRKQGFAAYVRLRGWSSDGSRGRSLGTDLICFAILSPVALGATFMCMKSALSRKKMLHGDDEMFSPPEVLALLIMSFFLIVVYCLWISVTIAYHTAEFHLWQKRNEIVYVVDQTDEVSEHYNGNTNRLSESRRPLLKRKICRFLCCLFPSRYTGRNSVINTISLPDSLLGINPQLIDIFNRTAPDSVNRHLPPPQLIIQRHRQPDIITNLNVSTPMSFSHPSSSYNRTLNLISNQDTGVSRESSIPDINLSTFRSYVTNENGYLLCPTPNNISPSLINERVYIIPPEIGVLSRSGQFISSLQPDSYSINERSIDNNRSSIDSLMESSF